MKDLIEDGICPMCGGDIHHWHQEIYQCEDCGVMIPLEDDED